MSTTSFLVAHEGQNAKKLCGRAHLAVNDRLGLTLITEKGCKHSIHPGGWSTLSSTGAGNAILDSFLRLAGGPPFRSPGHASFFVLILVLWLFRQCHCARNRNRVLVRFTGGLVHLRDRKTTTGHYCRRRRCAGPRKA